jgi:hypothetical protein
VPRTLQHTSNTVQSTSRAGFAPFRDPWTSTAAVLAPLRLPAALAPHSCLIRVQNCICSGHAHGTVVRVRPKRPPETGLLGASWCPLGSSFNGALTWPRSAGECSPCSRRLFPTITELLLPSANCDKTSRNCTKRYHGMHWKGSLNWAHLERSYTLGMFTTQMLTLGIGGDNVKEPWRSETPRRDGHPLVRALPADAAEASLATWRGCTP